MVNAKNESKEDINADGCEDSYIDSLFFSDLPKTAKSVSKEELVEKPVSFDLEGSSYVDQSFFQDPESEETLSSPLLQKACDCIADVREELSINKFTGGKLDFKNQKPYKAKYDSKGYRIPDDDPIKFHLLTEDEATEVLFRCIVNVQENIVAINKPPGIACQGGRGQNFSVDSLLPRLAFRIHQKTDCDLETFHLTHRIDKETTGLLLISRNQDTHLKLTEAFANRWIRKTYLCVTSGIPRETEGDICFPISEKRIGGNYKMVARRPLSQKPESPDALVDEPQTPEALDLLRKTTNAVTHYKVLDFSNDTALVQCCAVTGVKHQVRAHLGTGLDTPILGDHKYSHFGHLAPQRLSKRTLEALGVRQSKVRYMGLHMHALGLHFDGNGGGVGSVAHPPPPGFFGFLGREQPRQARHLYAPVPAFFMRTLDRLRLRIPRAVRYARFKLF